MKKIIVTNGFSINMLSPGDAARLTIQPISREVARDMLTGSEFLSIIGHKDLAEVVSSDLGVKITANRVTYTVDGKTAMLICQYRGERLPEGAKKLPKGSNVDYYYVALLSAPPKVEKNKCWHCQHYRRSDDPYSEGCMLKKNMCHIGAHAQN